MRAQLLKAYGETSNFYTADIAPPKVRAGHVVIKVAASSVNPIDCKLRELGETMPIAPKLPALLGIDVAGEVTEIGDGVIDFQVGDKVYGCAGGIVDLPGALSEYVLADVDMIAHAPKNISLIEAAALPLVGITAWEAIFERVTLTHEDTLLIYGGTGGVGHIAVQLAKTTGAQIVTTASSDEKATLARHLGAHEVFHARDEDINEVKERLADGGFDVVFDTIGGPHLTEAFQATRPLGEIVTIVSRGEIDLSLMHAKGLSLHVVFMLLPMIHDSEKSRYAHILRGLARRVEDGSLRPLLDPNVFAPSQIAAAHDYLESGKAVGKVMIDFSK